MLRVLLLLALPILAMAPAYAQEPLFTIVQISDSQARDAADQEQFESVLDTIAAGGQDGALLPRLADLVIFPGDLVWSDSSSDWDAFVQSIDSRLTSNGIPFFAVPGNHDHEDYDFSGYEQYIADSGPWDFGSSNFVGHNGIAGSTGWKGLRFVGFNNSYDGDNQLSAADVSDVEARVAAAAGEGENVFLVGHYAHDHGGVIPLINALETPEVRGYMRGHAGTARATHGIDGTSNGEAWELNSQSIFEDGALIYYEVFETQIDVYVLTLVTSPTELPAADVIALAHPLVPADVGPPSEGTAFQPTADAKVRSSRADRNYGLAVDLRVKRDSSIYDSYVQFDVTGIDGSVVSAVLRLYVTDGSSDGGTLYEVDDDWTETGLTWNNAPAIGGAPIGSLGAVSPGWIELDVSAVVAGEGTYSFALTSSDSNSAYYSSREGAYPPELVVETDDRLPPVADFDGAPRSGTAPLSVDFTDRSSGAATSWSWTFGDGGSSTDQHPTHVYTSAGIYTVGLTASNADGSDSITLVDYVVVDAPLGVTADFDAAPTNGSVPLSVAFTDLSTGSPSSWLWEFGDGATSGLQHPVHTYTEAGLYSVTLTVANGTGTDSVTLADLVSVGATAGVSAFEPVADATVRSKRRTRNYGLDSSLHVKDGGSSRDSYLKFDVTGLDGSVTSAVLRLYVTDGSPDGGTLYQVDGGWTESGITWNNAPPIGGAPVASVGAASPGWVELDVSAVVTDEGSYSFALSDGDNNSAYYSSREGAYPPELVVTTSP
jgi:PKD repeat protein